MNIGAVYVGLLILGVAYAAVAGAMGWLSGLGGDVGVHMDASGHLDAGHLHPISGTTIATFITGFGAGGTLAHFLFGWSKPAGLACATGSGLALAAAAYFVLELVFTHTQAGSEFAVSDMAGRDAEITVAIPSGGVGEIAFQVKGQRELAAARTIDGSALTKGQAVVIDRVGGPTVYVRAKGH
jgi:membrane protein implicated in regulation of membrane protease activity